MNSYPVSSPDQQPVSPPQTTRVAMPASRPYMTYSIMGITIGFYLLQLLSVALFGYANDAAQMDWLEFYGSKINELIRDGQVWRLLTPVLLHASIPHILFNMYALLVIGVGLERHFGHWRYLLLYLLGGFTGNVLSFLFTSGYSVGASTAIFGLIGAEGVFLYQNRQLFGRQFGRAIGNVIFIVVVNLAIDFVPGSGIDYWGHIGGLLGGLIFAWFAGPRWEVGAVYSPSSLQNTGQGMVPTAQLVDKRELREIITGAAIVILIFSALAVVGMIYPITP
jgi:rhomboid protease GluP